MKPRKHSAFRRPGTLIAAVSFAMSLSAAHAADQTWNPAGPTNNWNTTDANWDAGVAWTQANNAIFGGSGETVTLTEGLTAGGLTFSTGGYTIIGNTLTLAAASIIDTGANSATISTSLAGGPIAKAGSGTLILSGTNAYSGSTTINAGTLQPASAAALPTGTAVNLTTAGAKLNLGTPGQPLPWVAGSAVAQAIHSAGYAAAYAIDGNLATRWAGGPGHWIYADLGSTQSIGQFRINWEAARSTSFVIQTSNDASTWTTASGTFSSSAANVWETYNLNGGASGQYVRMLSAANVFGTGGGDSIWEMQALSVPSGAGTYNLGSLSGVAGTVVDMLGIGSTLKVGSDNSDTAFAGSLLGGSADSFVKEGTGTLTWVGTANYLVAPTVTGGTLKVDLSGLAGGAAQGLTLPGSTIKVEANGILQLQTGTATVADSTFFSNGAITGSGTITKTGTGYLGMILSVGVKDFTGFIDIQQGILGNNGSGWAAGAGLMDLNIAADAMFDMRTQNVKIDALSGAGTIGKTWSGNLNLSLGNNDGSGTFSGVISQTIGGGSGTISVTKNGSGTQTLSGACTYAGATTVNRGTLALAGDATLASPTLTLAEGGRLDTSGLTADFTLATGQTLSAGRTAGFAEDVKGNLVISDGSLHIAGPGNTAGTLTQTGKLTLGGGILKFDLAATDTPGAGVNDLIAVTGDLALLDSTTITVNKLTGTLSAGSYTLISCTGALTGNAADNLVLDLADIGRQSYALATTANSVVLNVTGVPASLVWTGASATNPTFWDQNTTANWTGGPNGKFADGDVVLFDDTATATIVDVQGWMAPISVTFNNSAAKPYSIIGMGSIDGATGITKNGNGLVTITNDNSNTGAVALNGGIVSIATGDGLGTGAITIDGGTLAFTGATAGWTRSLTLNVGGGAFDITDSAGELTSTGPFAGVGALTKAGAGTLVLGAPNNHTGATTITAGTLELRLSTGYTTKSSGYAVAAGAAFTFRMPTTGYDGNLSSPLSGAGTVNLINNGWSMHLNADNSAFTGTVTTSGNSTLFLDTTTSTSASTAYVIEMTGGNPYGCLCTMGVANGSTIHLGSLAGTTPTSKITSGYHGPGTLTWSVGALGTDTTFGGYFANYNMTTALTKVGTGKLTLTGANTYTGATTITQGTLQVDGSIAAGSSVTVQSAATLAGTGSVGGNVSVEAGGFVAPGNAGIGTLTVGSAALTGTYQCQLDVAAGDQVVVSGTLTVNPGATIAVSTLGTPAAASYVIATYGSLAGGAPAVTGIPAGYVLDTTTAGELKLVKSGGFGAWADSFEGLTDKTPGGDPDGDGIKNLIEYVIGGDPRVSSTGFLPKQAIVGTNLVLSYQRSDASEADTIQTGQWSTNLVDWNTIAPVQVNENDTAPDDMTLSIPLSNAAGGKLFGRLHVTMP